MATQAAVAIQPNEEKLIRAGQRGDERAVETLFRRYQRPLFQTALRVLGNTEDAEDALQDGLLSAYRNLKRFEGRSQFSTWLTRIDRKSTRLNSSHLVNSYAVFCLKKKKRFQTAFASTTL